MIRQEDPQPALFQVFNDLCASATTIGSMPEKGSSSRRNDGFVTNARVISRRRRSPPTTYRLYFWPNARCSILQEATAAVFAFPRTKRQSFQDRQDILGNGQLPEDRRFLRQISHPQLAPLMDGLISDIFIIKNISPAFGLIIPTAI